MRAKAQVKRKNRQIDFIKIKKKYPALKDPIHRVRRQFTRWKKIFANPIVRD